jgi:hypothetical protein
MKVIETETRCVRSSHNGEIIAEVVKRAPNMVTRWSALTLYRNPQDSEHMIEALREAGFS